MKFQPRINPVTLKELRQLVRSRLILWGMTALPIVLLIATGAVLMAKMQDISLQEATYGKGLGEGPLIAVSIITAIVTCVLIPLFTSIKTAIETSKTSLGLEFTTALTPAQIVTGKIAAATIIAALAVALAMPFFVLSYLMRGIELSTTVTIPVSLLVSSMSLTALGLLPACSRRSIAMKITQLILLYMFLPMFLSGFLSAVGMALFFARGFHAPSPVPPLASVFTLFLLPVALIAYCRAQAAAELAPPHTDYLRPLRITQLVLFAASSLLAFAGESACFSAGVAWCMIAFLIMLRAASCPLPITRGAMLHLPKSQKLRAMAYPLATGSVPSMFFAITIAIVASLVMAETCPWHSFKGLVKFFIAAMECGGLVVMAGAIARMIHPSRPRTANLLARAAIAYIGLVNMLTLLAGLELLDEKVASSFPCNFEGIRELDTLHSGMACVFATGAIVLLVYAAEKDFKRFRRSVSEQS